MSTLNDPTDTASTPTTNDNNRKTVRRRQNKAISIIDRLRQTTIKITTNPSERRAAAQQSRSKMPDAASAPSCSVSLRPTILVMYALKRLRKHSETDVVRKTVVGRRQHNCFSSSFSFGKFRMAISIWRYLRNASSHPLFHFMFSSRVGLVFSGSAD